MKKILLTLSAAALVLASCAKIETVKVDENRAISFSSFVNKPTKAGDVTEGNFAQFWVYGAYQNASGWANIFTNVAVNKGEDGSWTTEQTAYWTVRVDHNFAAYADGESKLSNVTFDAATAALTFENYTVSGNDLVVARASEQSWDGTSTAEPNPVELTFKHMLSKVKFTFTTTDSEDYIYKVTDLKINALKTVTGTYNAGGITWQSNGTNGDYLFAEIDDFAEYNENLLKNGASSEELYVIPQSNELLVASFTITAYDSKNIVIGSRNYSDIKVAYTGTVEGTTTNSWTPGFSYNYTAAVTLPQIVDNKKPITFSVDAVEGWKNATGTDLTIE